MKKQSTFIAALCLLLVSLAHSASGQAVGFLGKKNLIGYQADFWPGHVTMGRGGSPDLENFNVLQLKHSLSYQRIVSRDVAIYLRGSMVNSSTKPDRLWEGGYEYRVASDITNRVYSGYEASIGYRRYRSISAPVGRYAGWSLSYTQVNTQVDYGRYEAYEPIAPPLSETEEQTVSATLWRLNFEWGRNVMLSESLSLDYGIRFSFPLVPFGAYSAIFNYDHYYSEHEFELQGMSLQEQSAHYVQLGMVADNLVMLRLGLHLVR